MAFGNKKNGATAATATVQTNGNGGSDGAQTAGQQQTLAVGAGSDTAATMGTALPPPGNTDFAFGANAEGAGQAGGQESEGGGAQPPVQETPAGTPTTALAARETLAGPLATLSRDLAAVLVAQGIEPDQLCGFLDMNHADEHLTGGIPFRRIEYAATQKTADLKKGLLTDTASKEQKAAIRCVLLAGKFARAMWGKFDPAAPSDQALCASKDGLVCSGGSQAEKEGWIGTRKCADCPLKNWGAKQANGKSAAPECSENFVALMLDRDDQSAFVFTFRRTAVRPYRDLRNQIRTKAARNAVTGILPAYLHLSVGFTMKTENKGIYYVPTFGEWENVPPEQVADYATDLRMLLAQFSEVDVGTGADLAETADETAAESGSSGGSASRRSDGHATAPDKPWDTGNEPPHPGAHAAPPGGQGQGQPSGQPAVQAAGTGGRKKW